MNLSTTYMGLSLRSPLIASASPLTRRLASLEQIQAAGAGAVVLPSLFEEQIHEEAVLLERSMDGLNTEARQSKQRYPVDPEQYLQLIREASARMDIPVIGSLNGYSDDGWIEYARMIEQAGAAGLELNITYRPLDMHTCSGDMEARYIYILESVKSAVRIPVAIKMMPYFSALSNLALQLADTGVDALVLFNRIPLPDWDVRKAQWKEEVVLSQPYDVRFPLLWLAQLSGRIPVSWAASSGVRTGHDVVKCLACGAHAAMCTAALLEDGIDHLATMIHDLRQWMEQHDYTSIDQFLGCARVKADTDVESMARSAYVRMLCEYKTT